MGTKVRAALQTYHAIQATDLAAAFNSAMQRVRIAPGDYVAELTAPAGPSTAGGVQALQHIRLVPGQTGHPTLVVGYANHAEEKAELKTFEHLDAVHQQRFGRPLAINRGQYEDFLRLAKQILEALHLKTNVSEAPLDFDEPSSSARWKTWVLAFVLTLVALGVWRMLGKR